MNSRLKTVAGRFRVQGSGGFSLVELVVAVAMAAVIGLGIYAIFHAQQRSSRSQKTYNDLLASCTSAMDTVKNDLLLAGYKSKSDTQPISSATTTAITFDFLDDNAPPITIDDEADVSSTWSNNTRVTYFYDSTARQLKKTVERYRTSSPAGYAVPSKWATNNSNVFVLAENVDNFSFQYLAQDNADTIWTHAGPTYHGGPGHPGDTISEDERKLVRMVRIALLCEAAQDNAIYKVPALGTVDDKYKTQKISLTAEVRPRNIAVGDNPEDKTPPATPVGLKSWDEGQCGCLKLRWTSNTEDDIAGYTIYYGLTNDTNYFGRARVTHQSGANQYFTLQNLSATGAPYYLAITAYDKSGNQSAFSSPNVFGTASVNSESGTGSDTTINPLPPPAPGSPAVATPAPNQLQLSWVKTYADCMSEPTFGYRIYRSSNPSFTPQGTVANTGNCIATLGPGETSYLDLGATTPQGQLVGCSPYTYKIAVLNCDPSQLSNYPDPTTSNYTAAQFASVVGTPTDDTAPPDPVLLSTPGFRRIILRLTNPLRDLGQTPDFTTTRVYFSKAGLPFTILETRDAEGFNIVKDASGAVARLIPDGGGEVTAAGGVHRLNFDSEDYETPSNGINNPELDEAATYYFVAIAYDICKNHSNVVGTQAVTQATQCNDCLVGDLCRDKPPAPANIRVTQGCYGSPLRIDWDYSPSNIFDHPDFQGFKVLRSEGPEWSSATMIDLSGNSLTPDQYQIDATVEDGKYYTYRVVAGDCYYQRSLFGMLTAAEIAANPPGDKLSLSSAPGDNWSYNELPGLALGFFDRARVTGGDAVASLNGDLDAAATTVEVLNPPGTTAFTSRLIQIGTELIECSGVTASSFTGCTRGAEATVPISHFNGDFVRSYPAALPRAAYTGDLTLEPPTFRHNDVTFAALNTSADTLTLKQLSLEWFNHQAWFKKMLYDYPPISAYDTTPPVTNSSAGSNVTLSNIVVANKSIATNVPVTLTFTRPDGTVDDTVDMRGDVLRLTWLYENNATKIENCSRAWFPPDPVVPPGPELGGTTQSHPATGTLAWPIPGGGTAANSMDAVQVPAGSTVRIFTNAYDSSGSGISSVRLYYRTDCHGTGCPTTAPPVTGTYPACEPYYEIDMNGITGTSLYWADIPKDGILPSENDNKTVWYFIVATDNEKNFDRDPEVDHGAYQYYQLPPDPCGTTPESPTLVGSSSGNSVTLDWSGSWTGTPPTYKNDDGPPASACVDLKEFRVFHKKDAGTWSEVAGSPFSPATTSVPPIIYPTASTTLSWEIPLTMAAPLALSVNPQTGFVLPGKVKVGTEIFYCTGMPDIWHFSCSGRSVDGTTAAYHGAGTPVTQNPLELETHSYFVRALDTCDTPTGAAKFADSAIYTEGTCAPTCDMTVTPNIAVATPATSFNPGDTFTVNLTICSKAGNGGVPDTIYLQGCSDCDVDAIGPITEQSGDAGKFLVTVGTLASSTCTGGGGNLVLTVRNTGTDTIKIGGWSDVPGVWGTTCQNSGYSCGAQRTLTIATPPPNPCATDHTPGNPSDLKSVAATGTCSGTPKTKKQQLQWNEVTDVPAGCGTLTYKGYYCKTPGCTPTTASAPFAAADWSYTCAGGVCTTAEFGMQNVLQGNDYRFSVTAVCTISTCPATPPATGTVTQTWSSTIDPSLVAPDLCP